MASRASGVQPRAATACTACRTRRTKCIADPGDASCKYCRSKGQECIFYEPDERKRPQSKVYLTSLLENIESLEQRLREAGCEPPQLQGAGRIQQKQQHHPRTQSQSHSTPETVPPKNPGVDPTRDKALWHSRTERNLSHGSVASVTISSEPGQQPEDDQPHQLNRLLDHREQPSARHRSASEPQLDRSKRSTVWTMIYGPDRLIYDKARGRVHYFSPATCFKNYVKDYMTRESGSLDKWLYKILTDIPADLETYLMDIFWNRYNSTLCLIDQEAFCRDQANGASTFYSGLLHLACLAMAFHFANKDWPGMRQVALNDGSSVFQREVKYILDRELDNPRGLTTIQAMLVLSDTECACGRDDLAAMHVGTACRLAFDFGLNLDASSLGLPEAEVRFRNNLLRSCMIYDRAWALYLERPTNMKLCDISSCCLNTRVSEATSSSSSPQGSPVGGDLSIIDIHGQLLDALLDLTEISSRISEVAQPRLVAGAIADENRLIDVAILDTKLKSWYAALPSQLKWTPENVKSAPRLFFMMHQQYCVARILLHGPYAHYEDLVGIEVEKSHIFGRRSSESSSTSPWQRLARSITIEAAMKLAQSFSAYRQRFGTCQISVLSLQQGGTTCLTLMCITKASMTAETRRLALQHLFLLVEQLQEMSEVYIPAKVICSVVKHEMEQLRIDFTELPTPPQTPDVLYFPPSDSRVQRAGSESSVRYSDSDPAPKRRRLDRGASKNMSVPLLSPDLNQDMGLLAASNNLNHNQITDSDLPAAASNNASAEVFEDGYLDSHLEHFDHPADPSSDLHIPASRSSWPMDISVPTTAFDSLVRDDIVEAFLPPWPPDSHFFDLVDDGFGSLSSTLRDFQPQCT